MKKYPHGLTLTAVCAAIEDYQRHEDSVPEEGILAAFNTLLGHSDIAEALRSTERTADANMAAAQAMRDYMYHWKQRAEAAEARLAELEKQQAVGVARMELTIGREGLRYYQCFVDMRPDLVLADLNTGMELFTRPAPAADVVPDGWKLVPVEPTEEMIAAGDKFMDGLSHLGDAYDAMLAAAPEVE